jgi:hypothetical protein
MRQSKEEQEFYAMFGSVIDELEKMLTVERRDALRYGVELTLATVLGDVYEARFGRVPKPVAAAVSATRDLGVLRSLLRLAAVGSSAEVAAAIRASAPRRRASAPARTLRA